MTFDGQGIWFRSARVYPSGLYPVGRVTAPAAMEEASMQFGAPAALHVARGTPQAGPTGNWSAWISLAQLRSFTVDKVRYTVPAGVGDVLVLPIAAGIVWAVHRPSTPHVAAPAPESGFPPGSQDLSGSTDIFFTPYAASGGALDASAQRIATVPDDWPALASPVADSAWTGFLPANSVRPAASVSLAAHAVWNGPGGGVSRETVDTTAVPGWPTAFRRQVGREPAGQDALPGYVTGLHLDRTEGGFVLEVLLGMVGGQQSGMTEADYYWSAGSREWTPLVQLYEDATLVSFTDVGSRAVYWQLTLPGKGADRGGLALVQMHFDPSTLSMNPVWAGDFIYGQTFVDGSAWVHNLPSPTGAARWSANAP